MTRGILRSLWVIVLVGISASVANSAPIGLGAWNAAYEADPADVDPIAQGAGQIRVLKESSRERGEVEHCWGPAACGGSDTGIHSEGSAVTLVSADCSAEAIAADRDDGWLCFETGADPGLWIVNGGAWTSLVLTEQIVASGTIVIFNHATTCPTGYTEYTDYAGVLLRGRDQPGTNADIPDNANETCTGDGSGNPNCDGGLAITGKYADTITTTQMPTHAHTIADASVGPGPPQVGSVGGTIGLGTNNQTTNNAGSGGVHYHPFRTVLFCEKD